MGTPRTVFSKIAKIFPTFTLHICTSGTPKSGFLIPSTAMTYPADWPRPNVHKPLSLQTRITELQKHDLYHRRITTKDLATQLGVHARYLSYMFPGKEPIVDKAPLIQARRDFKLAIAREILQNKYNIVHGAKIANVSYNTMQRFLAKAKVLYPIDAEGYRK